MKLGGIKVSSAEIELLLNTLPGVVETAAIAVEPAGGGPNALIIYVVLEPHTVIDLEVLKKEMQEAIRDHLNPLFKIAELISIEALPRTASNKVMRRVLRDK
jgi:acetyl-CoA synthetase